MARICENGTYRDMTEEEIAELQTAEQETGRTEYGGVGDGNNYK